MRKLVAGIILVVIGAALVFSLRKPTPDLPQPTRGGPVATLLGTTNVSGQTVAAQFHITNQSDQILVCSPEAIEFLENGVWINKPLVGKAMWRASREWIGFREELKPHSAFTFTVPSPTNNLDWRVVVACQERAAVRDTVADIVSNVTATNAAQKNAQQFSGKRYSITTPAVHIQ
ncbi:MAG: hypothetical protein ACK4UN_08480 [Limisphaerales bacterium]